VRRPDRLKNPPMGMYYVPVKNGFEPHILPRVGLKTTNSVRISFQSASI
jgi:hypothetical protein